MEFEKGKEVRVIANNNGHDYEIGSIITMYWQCSDKEFEAKEFNTDQLDLAFEYFKTLRTAFDQDKALNKIMKEKKKWK